MAEYQDREHYIPLRKSDLVELLCADKSLSRADREAFRQLCVLIAAVFHFEYHKRLEELKNDYAPFDPDAVTKPIRQLPAEERQAKLEELFADFDSLLERANFKKLDHKALHESSRAASEFGLQMTVDFHQFEKLAGYVRGEAIGTRHKRHWLFFWQKDEVKVPVYQRLAVIAKLRTNRYVGREVDINRVYLKIFKDIPRMDLKMLLPGARLRMPSFQRWKMSGSWIGGLGYLLYSLSAQLVDVLAHGMWWVFWGPLSALAGYGYKQWYGYQTTKTAYGLQLTRSLYFQSLDSNAGVLYHLLDEAEEQECREAMLAYYYLWRHAGETGWTSANLDDYVELDLERMAGLKVDFEIGDALAKLERHKLVERVGDSYRAQPIDKALEMLDWTWDNYFKYNNPEPEVAPIP
jgi:hypothetical protein